MPAPMTAPTRVLGVRAGRAQAKAAGSARRLGGRAVSAHHRCTATRREMARLMRTSHYK